MSRNLEIPLNLDLMEGVLAFLVYRTTKSALEDSGRMEDSLSGICGR